MIGVNANAQQSDGRSSPTVAAVHCGMQWKVTGIQAFTANSPRGNFNLWALECLLLLQPLHTEDLGPEEGGEGGEGEEGGEGNERGEEGDPFETQDTYTLRRQK